MLRKEGLALEFWVGLLELILINIVLSGDNAVVVAMASRKLPPEQQKKAILWGSIGAIALRVMLTFVAVKLLSIPYLQLAGAILLVYIAVQLLQTGDKEEEIKAGGSLGAAIRTIILADLVMSLDNVLAMAGAAQGNYLLIFIGLAMTVPLIIWASKLLVMIMDKYPIIVILGAALLGYTAGEMLLDDKAVGEKLSGLFAYADHVIPVVIAIAVLIAGRILNSRHSSAEPKPEAGDR
ncbi:TerC family protein [Paenibacillus humicus]